MQDPFALPQSGSCPAWRTRGPLFLQRQFVWTCKECMILAARLYQLLLSWEEEMSSCSGYIIHIWLIPDAGQRARVLILFGIDNCRFCYSIRRSYSTPHQSVSGGCALRILKSTCFWKRCKTILEKHRSKWCRTACNWWVTRPGHVEFMSTICVSSGANSIPLSFCTLRFLIHLTSVGSNP